MNRGSLGPISDSPAIVTPVPVPSGDDVFQRLLFLSLTGPTSVGFTWATGPEEKYSSHPKKWRQTIESSSCFSNSFFKEYLYIP